MISKQAKNKLLQTPRKKMLVEELEQRILYSADAAAGLIDTAQLTPNAEVRMFEESIAASIEPMADAANDNVVLQHELIIVDTSVENYQTLVDDILANQDETKQLEIILLDADRDGIEQISEILSNYSDVSAIHLVGEGTAAELHLAGSFLTLDSINNQYAESLKEIGNHLSENADILIYGCNFGQGELGLEAVEAFGDLTGADIAASDDRTGHASAFANWALEINYGIIETEVFLSQQGQENWLGALATFTVTNTNDALSGSLRQAIIDANNTFGADQIRFNIAGSGPHTISLTSALPIINDTVTIDGTTEPDYVNSPVIELNGANVGINAAGLQLSASANNSIIRGLAINRFSTFGILLQGADNVTIAGNYIGLDLTGELNFGNTLNGINVNGADNLTIGGTTAADRNVISGNLRQIEINGSSTNTVIQGNYIGTDKDGNQVVGGSTGIILFNASNITIGGTASGAGNVISGMSGFGIQSAGNPSATIIQGNYIGTNASGDDIGNSGSGIGIFSGSSIMIGGTSTNAGNVIAFNNANGIELFSGTTTSGHSILGNSIYSNSDLGIDLANDGVTPNDLNDTDTGQNNLQNYPILSSANTNGSTTTIDGSLNSRPSTTYRIEFFSNQPNAGDPTGYGEGQTYLGFSTVTTNISGNAFFNETLVAGLSAGDLVTAIVTVDLGGGNYGDSSEFARNIVVNDDPVLTNGGTASASEDTTATPFYGIATVSDNSVSFSGGILTANITAGAETTDVLSVGSTEVALFGANVVVNGIIVGTSAGGVNGTPFTVLFNANATVARVEDVFRAISYSTSSDNPTLGLRTISVSITDGNGGTSNIATGIANLNSLVNDDPVNTGSSPTRVTVNEDQITQIDLSAFTINDPDSNNGLLTMSFRTGSNGNIWLAAGAGITRSGSGTSIATISGTQANINNYLDTIGSFGYSNDVAHINGIGVDSIQVDITDNGNTGSGGGNIIVFATIAVDITPVNDEPIATNLNTAETYTEDTPLNLINIVVTDVDNANTTVTLTLSDVAAGSLSTATSGLVTSTFIAGVWTASGAIADVNALLASVTFSPALNYDQNLNIITSVDDGIAPVVTGAKVMTIIPVNDAPTTTPVTLTAIAENSGPRIITQAELLINAADVDGPSLAATNLAIATGLGTLVDNLDGTWTYTPALNDDTAVSFTYTVTDGALTAAGSANLDITSVNNPPTTTPVTLGSIVEDSGPRIITQAELLINANDVDSPSLTATNLAIATGLGTLVDNLDGTWTYTPALNDDTAVSFTYTVTDGALTAAGSANLDITPVNDGPTTSTVTLTAIAEDSGPRIITQAELLINAADVDGPSLAATNLAIATGLGTLVDNLDGTWTYTPALNDDTAVSFTYTVTDGALTAAGSANLDITSVNNPPTTTPVTLGSIVEDSGPRIITQAELLINANDVDSPSLTATNLAIATGLGTLVDNLDGTWTYTPALNDDTTVSFTYTVTDGALTAAGSANLDITPVNDGPTTSTVTLTAIAEESGPRIITQVELLANAVDVDGDTLSASGLAIATGLGTLVDNLDGTWTYTPALDDDTAVSFTYTVTDGALTAAGSANLDITPVNDGPTTSTVTLTAIAEDSGPRIITQAELLINAADVDGPSLAATNLAIATGLGTLVDNLDGTWTYTPALNDDTAVSFTYTVTDGALTAAGSANLDITPVNDAPTTTPVTLGSIVEDSGPRIITQAELLANAVDVDGDTLSASGLAIATGLGTLVDNLDGTWTYTPALNDDTAVSFTYTVTDNTFVTTGTATLDITPINDPPTTTPVTLTAIAEDSGPRIITQAQLLINASGPNLVAEDLAISAGLGTLVDNLDGTWTYTPALNDETNVTFDYVVRSTDLISTLIDGSASLDITPVNDGPTTTPVTLTAIAENSGPRIITQAELLINAADVDGPSLAATNLAIATGLGTLVDNLDGTWTYTPALNDDTAVSFTYTVTDGALTAAGSANLDITSVNNPPTTTPVTLGSIVEDSGPRIITQAELLINANDVDSPSLTATNLAIATGLGTLVDNLDGTWTYTPALNDDTAVSFTYTVTDGALTAAGSANLDITPVNDGPTTSTVTLTAIAENSGPRIITQAELLINAADVDGPSLAATNLAIATGLGTLVDNLDGTWTYTPALNDDTAVSFTYTVTDGALTAAGSANLDITSVNNPPTTTPVTLGSIVEDSGPRIITQAELLINANDVDSPSLTATNLAIATGLGTLVDNLDGTWTYTPALNDDTAVSFTYTVTDGALTAAGSANLDITPVNDGPTTSTVTLTAIAEESGPRIITQAELLINAADVDGPSLAATNLAIATGLGTLVDNLDGTWTYTPALDDDTAVSFTYTVTDGALTAAGSANLDITPVNDAPVASGVYTFTIRDTSVFNTFSSLTGFLSATDMDHATSSLVWSVSNGAGSYGNLSVNANGAYTYTPNNTAINSLRFGENPSDTFIVTVTDPSGGTDTRTITINLIGADELVIGPPTIPTPTPTPEPVEIVLDDPTLDIVETKRPTLISLVEIPNLISIESYLLTSTLGLDSPETSLSPYSNTSLMSSIKNDIEIINFSDGTINWSDVIGAHYQDIETFYQIELDNINVTEIKDGGLQGTIQASSAIISASTFWWALRATGLLAGLMASLPTWRQVDFLSVLNEEAEDTFDIGADNLNEESASQVLG